MKSRKLYKHTVFLGLAVIFVIIGIVNWQNRSHNNSAKIATQVNKLYTFSEVNIDTSKWKLYEPFRGFSVMTPSEWIIEDGGATYLFTNNYAVIPDNSGWQNKKSGEITSGAKIKIQTVRHSPPDKSGNAEQKCKATTHQKTTILKYQSLTVCEMQIATDNKQTILAYDYWAYTKEFDYLLSVSFAEDATSEAKNEYISTARQMVESYK